MEDFIAVLPKLIEYGPLGIINILLIFKGIPAMNNLSNAVSKLADRIDGFDARVLTLERDIHDSICRVQTHVAGLDEITLKLDRIQSDINHLTGRIENVNINH